MNFIPKPVCFHKKEADFSTGSNPPYHRHNDYEIYLFIKGNTKLYIEQSCYQMKSGDLAIISPDKLHRSVVDSSDSKYERIVMYISKNKLNLLSSPETDLSECFKESSKSGHEIIHLSKYDMGRYISYGDDIIRNNKREGYGDDLYTLVSMYKLLLFLNNQYKEVKSNRHPEDIMPEPVKGIMEYIENNLTESITLSDISKHLHFNGNYISNVFKKNTGMTIRDYIIDKRLELAKSLLMQGHNVAYACSQSGFSDYANFIRTFTNRVGIPPKRWCRRNE